MKAQILACSVLPCHLLRAAAAHLPSHDSRAVQSLKRAVSTQAATAGASSSDTSAGTSTLPAVYSKSSQAAGDYSIAIPSYDRAGTLHQRTLTSLVKAGVDCRRRVHVFVANKEEQERYASALPRNSYADIIVGKCHKLGIGKQRSHILSHFGQGANVVMLDDDVKAFMQVYDGPVDLHKAVVTGFDLCQQHECFMWGISNSSNKFFMRQTYSTNWMFIQGPFMGFRVRQEVQLNPAHDDILEDVQYSLMHCHTDGKVLRLNGMGLKASPYGKEPGGMQSALAASARQARVTANREYLMREYGQYVLRWEEGMPHPKVRRSKQHMVRPLVL